MVHVLCISQPGVQGVFCTPNFQKSHPVLTNFNIGDIAEHWIAHPVLVKCTPWSVISS